MSIVRDKHYFVADVHLGLRLQSAHEREKSFVDWLRSIASDAAAIYLLGDIFDFWWEYKNVVPKGHVRVLGALAHLVDSGVTIHFFRGNHDRWTFGYLEKEVGIKIYNNPVVMEIGETRFCLGHGDEAEQGGRLLKKIFSSRFFQQCFSAMHPRWGVDLGYRWSAHNRKRQGSLDTFKEESDPLYRFASTYPSPVDCFIFGHLHTSVDTLLPNRARLVVLGEWMPQGHFAVFDETKKAFEVKSLSL